MFQNFFEVDLKVNNICNYKSRGSILIAQIHGVCHTGNFTTNYRWQRVFESERKHYDASNIERLWEIGQHIPADIQRSITKNIYNKQPFEYGKFYLDHSSAWYFMTDLDTHTLYLIVSNHSLDKLKNQDMKLDLSEFNWSHLPEAKDNYYHDISYTSIVFPSSDNYSTECHKIIDKLSEQYNNYFKDKKNHITFNINGHYCGYIDTIVDFHYNKWSGKLTINLPIEGNNLIRPYLFNKYIVDSNVDSTWGENAYDRRYKEFTFYGAKNEMIDKIGELLNQIKNELNTISSDEAYYVLNNTGYYTISTDYPSKKPNFYKIELFIPTDETGLIRKDLINFDKIVLGEKLCGDWGWLTQDKKFRYRSLELPSGSDYKKEIQVLI